MPTLPPLAHVAESKVEIPAFAHPPPVPHDNFVAPPPTGDETIEGPQKTEEETSEQPPPTSQMNTNLGGSDEEATVDDCLDCLDCVRLAAGNSSFVHRHVVDPPCHQIQTLSDIIQALCDCCCGCCDDDCC